MFDRVLNTPLRLQCQRGLNCLKNNDGEDKDRAVNFLGSRYQFYFGIYSTFRF